jgi:hypothetical protein
MSMRQEAAHDAETLKRLRLYNALVGIVHLIQATLVFVLSNDFTLPITASFLAGPPGTALSEPEILWDVPIGLFVGVFLLLAAIDHLLMAAPGVWSGTPIT